MPLSEDGELPESPKYEFFIDRSCTSDIFPTENEVEQLVEKSQDSVWSKNMRKRLLDETEESSEGPSQKKRKTIKCFNCGGEHNISTCEIEIDESRVRKNRVEYRKQFPVKRLSKGVEKVSKYIPGELSSELRSALNMGPDDIPEWVYRMRRKGFYEGYPPGHLKKALIHSHHELRIFSDDHQETEECRLEPPRLIPEKLYSFFGFNATTSELRDFEFFRVPPHSVFCQTIEMEVHKEHEEAENVRISENRIRRRQIAEMRVLAEMQPEVVEKEPLEEQEKAWNCDLGESMTQTIGTPVQSRRDPSGVWIDEPIVSLDAFAVGIQPFEAREETMSSRGIFQQIMSKLRQPSAV